MVNNARRSQGARARGFTLLEALVVLAVLAVLLGLAVAGLQGMRERQQLQAEAEDFWNSLMLARAQALLHQQHVTVCAASAAGTCHAAAPWHGGWLVFVDANRNGLREGDEPVLLQRAGSPAAIRIFGNSTVSRIIGYGADGRSESLSGAFQAGTVTVCTAGQGTGWQVVINALGRPRLEKTELSSCP